VKEVGGCLDGGWAGHDRHLYCFFLGRESYRSVHAGFLACGTWDAMTGDDVNVTKFYYEIILDLE